MSGDQVFSNAALAALPKIDLHRHLEGALRLSTLRQIARDYGLGLPVEAEAFRSCVQVRPGEPRSSANFLAKFGTLRRFFQSPEIIARVTAEAVEDAAADNVRYLELRFTPMALARARGYSLEAVADWVSAAAQAAAREHGIVVRLIASVNRHESLAVAERVAQLAADGQGADGVAGLDLAGDEVRFPAARFAGLFREARQARLGIVAHAGEWSGPESVREAIEHLQPDRIGHGVRVIEDESVVRLARERGLTFEVCLTSNLQSGVVHRLEDHPLPRMLTQGLKVTLNTDDPGISDICLSDDYSAALTCLGLSMESLRGMVLASAEAAFLPETERAALVRQFKQQLELE